MLIAKVVGSVVATQKDEKLANTKLLVLQIHNHKNESLDQYVIAVDSVGAGTGDIVLYAAGSSARQTEITKDRPCDAVVMAIVDSWDMEGTDVFQKWSEG
ncbi:MAG: EutN/CcmL family microcompartment protein [bacterium]|nr:EutN/CcmL family microcompartment protein [bacterium]